MVEGAGELLIAENGRAKHSGGVGWGIRPALFIDCSPMGPQGMHYIVGGKEGG